MNKRGSDKTGWPGRIEDEALLLGKGRFSDDIKPANAAYGVFVRSPYAHAKIAGVDTEAARASEGVIAVITGADLADAGYGSATSGHPMESIDGSPMVSPPRPVLATERVMHVGDPVALVIGESEQAAQQGAEEVYVDYEALPAVVNVAQASAAGAPQLWPGAPGNLALDWRAPGPGTDPASIEKAFADAAHVASVELDNQRLVAAALEPRAATASYDPDTDRYTLRVGTQGVQSILMQTAQAMSIPPEKLRFLTEDVGGGFGMKGSGYPEYVALLDAAKRCGRPVHWVATRSESFMSDNQGRDSLWSGELALDKDGRFLALKVEGKANVGAYVTGVASFCSTVHISGCLPAVYDIPLASVHSKIYLTNTVPIGPYRGAGRPEANYLLERLIDEAAQICKIDPAELRRRNLISADQIPYTTPFGTTYDSGDFPAIYEQALKTADYDGFAGRRAAAEKNGRFRGIGIGCYLEIAGAMPQEAARISFPGQDRAVVSIGAAPSGQGHRTIFARVAAQRFGIPEDAVTVNYGDSDRDPPGFGAVASRSAFMVGGAVAQAADEVVAKGREAAAILLQAADAELEFESGSFRVKGTERSISLFELAERAGELAREGLIPADLDTQSQLTAAPTFPNGCHVVELDIDPETGALDIARYTAVDDCGTIIDPVIVDGQIHGGVAQGLGQALTEHTIYDPESGQLVTGSLMDYALPRADDMPEIDAAHLEVPAKTNPLGAKGTGEAGTTAAPCAIMNAVANALPEGAAKGLEMPATPAKIWRALQA